MNARTILTQIVVLINVLGLQGCATILNEKTQQINVATSTGEKITAKIDGMSVEVPGIVGLTRAKGDKIITTDNPRCTPSTILPSEVDTIFFVNILSGGAFGSTTDYASEKMWKYQENVLINCRR